MRLMILFILVCVLAFIAGPLLTIFAVNTLFGLAVQVNVATWFSALWLTALVGVRLSRPE